MARKYELKQRAERQHATRQRIVDAAVALHEELGPARTSISAIADRAGVERLTVYRHFATEDEIFQACSARYDELHPLPDIAIWEQIDDPFDRLSRVLTDLYRYYEETEEMTTAVIRDASSTPALRETTARYGRWLGAIVELLMRGFAGAGIPADLVRMPIRLAIDFRTWQIMMREQGMDASQAAAYQTRIVRCIADPA